MSDESVRTALASAHGFVVIEAPAGCGKTYQAADYARSVVEAGRYRRPLILTHTHAACGVFAARTKGSGEIRTLDSLISQIAGIYHAGLGLPSDIGAWLREEPKKRYDLLAGRVARLLGSNGMIPAALARRHGVVICDEHQDATADRHAVVMSLRKHGAILRVFADPMQAIFKGSHFLGPGNAWETLCAQADKVEALSRAHRWTSGCPHLGGWTLQARDILKAGGRIDLRSGLPPSVTVVRTQNVAHRHFEFRPAPADIKHVTQFVSTSSSLLILSAHNITANSFRSLFYRTIPLWEGHIRDALDRLVRSIRACNGQADALARAVVEFLGTVATGFSPSAYGNRFEDEVKSGCAKAARGAPALVQELARCLVDDPSHRGVARALRQIADKKKAKHAFDDIKIERWQEFWDAIRLAEFASVDEGLAELARRRSYAHPEPSAKAISTIHKAKGLECGHVVLMPCDAQGLADTDYGRHLLYVALSLAKERLLFVVPQANPSPLLIL